jgi:hypothetical protein
MRRKKLSDFIKPSKPLDLTAPPLYSDARTGQIVASEPKETTGQPEEGASETNTTTDTILPELGNLPERMSTGTRVIIGKHNLELVRAGKDDEDCPCYRLRYQINLVGNQVFSVDDLNSMGAKLNKEQEA